MKTTSNFGLSVPELTDKPDIAPISENFEKLDKTLADFGGGFILMTESVPVSQRKKESLYALIIEDFTN